MNSRDWFSPDRSSARDRKEWRLMSIVDCLVSFFGLDENERPTYRRYFCYQIVAGPGPMAGSGVASIMTLAIHDKAERCDSCQHFHFVDAGGPMAAIAVAIRYLDSFHERDHLLKVESNIRGLGGGEPSEVRPKLGTGKDRNDANRADRFDTGISHSGAARSGL
jgi:hypothetical protein